MALDPRHTHNLDQFGAYARELAGHIGAFYRKLVDDGVPEAEARELTLTFGRMFFQDPDPLLSDFIGPPDE